MVFSPIIQKPPLHPTQKPRPRFPTGPHCRKMLLCFFSIIMVFSLLSQNYGRLKKQTSDLESASKNTLYKTKNTHTFFGLIKLE